MNNWNDIKTSNTHIPVPSSIGTWELTFRLPNLQGTTRQINWGRNIRHRILSVILSQMMEHAKDHKDPAFVYRTVNELRAQDQATFWIDRRATKNPLNLLKW